MKNKKIPMRMCVVTRDKLPKKELIRIVKNKENEIFVDESGKQNGKGVYLKLDKEVIEKARKNKILNRCLECEINDDVYVKLLNLVK